MQIFYSSMDIPGPNSTDSEGLKEFNLKDFSHSDLSHREMKGCICPALQIPSFIAP